jgi:hypothetical protein
VSAPEWPRRSPARSAPPRKRRVLRTALVVIGAVLAFVLGIAFARTVDDRPKSSGVVTRVRTLTPLPQRAPASTVTVTVTSTSP